MRNLKLKRPPALAMRYKLLLYGCTVLFSILSIYYAAYSTSASAIAIVCYTAAACFMLPAGYYLTLDIKFMIQLGKLRLQQNPYTGKVVGDYRLKTVVFAVPGLISNILFAGLHAIIGIWYQSAWFGSLAAYYLLLGIMRVGVVLQERRIVKMEDAVERMKKEMAIYRRNSILFIVMAVVLGGLVILLVLSEGGSSYPGFTIYAVAFYVFYKLIRSFLHMGKAVKYQSPLVLITRKIGHIDAWTSLLILQTAMFSAFGTGDALLVCTMNGITGTVVCLLILGMGIQGIRK